MNGKLLKNLGLATMLTLTGVQVNAAVSADSAKSSKPSPIEKALNQQKRGDYKLSSDEDQLKMITSLKAAPSQNFLAEQHQRFSRFVQALFPTHTS